MKAKTGEKIRAARKAAGLSQRRLAKAMAEAGTASSQGRVSKWESDAERPSPAAAEALSAILGINIQGVAAGRPETAENKHQRDYVTMTNAIATIAIAAILTDLTDDNVSADHPAIAAFLHAEASSSSPETDPELLAEQLHDAGWLDHFADNFAFAEWMGAMAPVHGAECAAEVASALVSELLPSSLLAEEVNDDGVRTFGEVLLSEERPGATALALARLHGIDGTPSIRSLDELLELLRVAGEWLDFPWDDLPSFGGEDVDDGWSWDEDRVLVGQCVEDLELVDRDDLADDITADDIERELDRLGVSWASTPEGAYRITGVDAGEVVIYWDDQEREEGWAIRVEGVDGASDALDALAEIKGWVRGQA